MKSYIKLAGLLLAICAFSNGMHAQSHAKKTTAPSDVNTGYTYDFIKARDLIIERVTKPNASNADVQVFLDQSDFPVLGKGKSVDADYNEKLKVWMEKNPNLIINTLKPRTDIVTQY
jgi:hypothetical protein